MVEGDYEAALKELEGQQENPAAFNYIGVCYMMKGDYDTAEKFLRKAEAAGDPYASVNLDLRRVSFLYWSSVGINFWNDRSDNRTLKKIANNFHPD